MDLWTNTPGEYDIKPVIRAWIPEKKRSDAAVVIFPGGSYRALADHEGPGYAEFLAKNGITAFSVDYRVFPHKFPLELLDARRAVRWVRANADLYGIRKDKIAVMGSSAGGHLAALVSTYREPLPFEDVDDVDREDYLPNAQILCYPVICSPAAGSIAHIGSYHNLLTSRDAADEASVDPSLIADGLTPPAFIWHTAADSGVNVINSYRYAEKLRMLNIAVEMHIFPFGKHGLGLAENDPHIAQWSGLLLNWLRLLEWLT
jgi:acetyl esterase/lipase